MMSTTKNFSKAIAAGASVALLVIAILAATVPAYAISDTAATDVASDNAATEVLPVYQAVSADEATAGTEVLPVFRGADQATYATGVQPMGVEGAPLLHALDEFGGWVLPFAAVAAAMLIALGIFGIQTVRARSVSKAN